MNLFKKRVYVPINPGGSAEPEASPSVPDGMWVKCPHCLKSIYQKAVDEFKTCPECRGNFRLHAWERIGLIADESSFYEINPGISSKNPMDYPGYPEKLNKLTEETGLLDAVVTGECRIGGTPAFLAVMDSRFIMASMGSAVGEKLSRLFEAATARKLPAVVFACSGGARMQEGIISLMQMAKTAQAVKAHSDAGLLYISVLTDPTTGGVTASFASLGDIILAEPGATIGFAGRRVIEQTINQKLPEDFQTAEFLLEHGFIDKIVHRREMKGTIANILRLHETGGGFNEK